MNIELDFDINKLVLIDQEPFIPKQIISNYEILSLDYVVNDIIVQRYDINVMKKIYDVISEDDFGRYVYTIHCASPTINNYSYFKINALRGTNAILYGEKTDNDNSEHIFYQHKLIEQCLFHGTNSHYINSKIFYINNLNMDKIDDIKLSIDNEKSDIFLIHVKDLTWTYTIDNYDSQLLYKIIITTTKPYIISYISVIENMIYIDNDLVINNITSDNIILPINKPISFCNKIMKVNLDCIKPPKISSTNNLTRGVKKPIINSNTCPISYNDITINNHYMQCLQCNNIFSYIEINKWLMIKSSCPMCRQQWSDMTIFKNA